MTKIKDLHKKWLRDDDYRREYDALEEEFALASELISARSRAGLTQEELAEKMDTSQSAIARMESGRTIPSGSTLKRFARATGTRLRITFEPEKSPKRA
ncbi:MAG: helix-turn-helix transcriptional regulator [Hyphomicrobiaceae bacterium]